MLRHILPKEHCFFTHFEEHIKQAILVCEEFIALTKKGADIPTHVKRIETLEHQSDEITHKCIEALHKAFITPMERTDIQKLIKHLDDIVDSMEGAASRIVLYGINDIRSETSELAEILLKATQEIEVGLRGLRNLKNAKLVMQTCIAIHDLEYKGDNVLRKALLKLFHEKDPVLIIKWKEIFERLERATDRCDDVADILEGVVLASS